ncbi:MAG: hypothetical protein ABSH12_02035 [Endomicrobiales bacterium]|jgi:hypothetical protein
MRKLLLLFFCSLLFVPLHARSFFQQQFDNNQELEIELDPYYSDIDYYVPLTQKPIICLTEQNEWKIYRSLLLDPVPRFLVFETSVNPMPCLGVFILKNEPAVYQRATVSPSLNLVQALTAGFEEPYAYSVFWGNVVSFRPQGSTNYVGKGYIGLLLSIGEYNIDNNELIEDQWFEAELKFKGDRDAPESKMSWSFRLGMRHNGNVDINDTAYFAVRRDRIDVNDYSFSLLKNIGYEYSIDIAKDTGRPIRQYIRFGKKFPLRNSKTAFSLDLGLLWQGQDEYNGPLRFTNIGDTFQILIQPNISF